jgi:hypothetical protein
MQRRDFIRFAGGAAAAHIVPAAVRAQVLKKRPLIAVLSGVTREDNQPLKGFMGGPENSATSRARISTLCTALRTAV